MTTWFVAWQKNGLISSIVLQVFEVGLMLLIAVLAKTLSLWTDQFTVHAGAIRPRHKHAVLYSLFSFVCDVLSVYHFKSIPLAFDTCLARRVLTIGSTSWQYDLYSSGVNSWPPSSLPTILCLNDAI